ncbi:hypothetical protein EMCRGX_G024115 [Ephydatia muelleri]
MATQPEPKPDDLPLRQHGRMADIMTTILTTGDVNAKVPILSCKPAEPSSPPLPSAKTRTSLPKKQKAPLPKEESNSESDDSDENQAEDIKKDSSVVKSCHVLPAAASLDQERKLQRIATRGVVELFNAVSKQQKEIEEKLDEAGSSERKKTKVLSAVNKGSFVSLLKGSKKQRQQDESQSSKRKEEAEEAQGDEGDDSKPSWNVLRKDYMMGSKLRDWDKSRKEEAEDEKEYASSMESE